MGVYECMYKANGLPAAMVPTILAQVRGNLETVPNMALKAAANSMRGQIPG